MVIIFINTQALILIMAYFSNPIKALLTDILPTKYVSSLFRSLNCGIIDEEYPVITLGSGGENVLMVTGFSVTDYKITNALIYMAVVKCLGTVFSIPTFSNSQLSRWTIRFIPMANPWPYNSWSLIKGVNELYGVDDDGIHVMHDALTLLSKYSIKLHALINNVKPNLILMLSAGDKFEITTLNNAKVGNYPQVAPDPTDFRHHFMLEGYPTLIVSIPRDWGPRDIARLLIDLLREYSIEWVNTKPLEALIKINGDTGTIVNTLKMHGIDVKTEGEFFLLSSRGQTSHLLNLLIDNNLLEHYFNINILEIRLPIT